MDTDKLVDVGAERAVLAGLMQYGIDGYIPISNILTVESFGNVNNQILFRCIENIIKNNHEVDIPSILSSAGHLGVSETLNTTQELKYMKSLMDFPVHKDNMVNFAIQIKKFEFARNIKKLTNKVNRDVDNINGSESVDEIIKILENPVTEFLREDSGGKTPEKIGNGVKEYIEYLGQNKCDIIGISTGFPEYDNAIGGGLRRKCVDLMAARPKTGKSVGADNIAVNIASSGPKTCVIDTEMSKEDHIHRIISRLSGVPIKEIETGKFVDDADKAASVNAAVEKLSSIPYYYISVAGKPFDQILNIIQRWVIQEVGVDENNKTNDCVVIFDYLKLMSASSISENLQEYQALGFQITALHNLCVKLDIACLAFAQLNRDGISKEGTDAISGSDRLIWLCTSFSIFKAKSPEEIAEDGPNAGNRKIVPIVARHGPCLEDGDYINLLLEGSHAKLRELKTRNKLKQQPSGGDTGMIEQDTLIKLNINGISEDQRVDA